ncbi:MAG: hypothetical protein R3B91_05830 [Planctomycetaceae bacterium]
MPDRIEQPDRHCLQEPSQPVRVSEEEQPNTGTSRFSLVSGLRGLRVQSTDDLLKFGRLWTGCSTQNRLNVGGREVRVIHEHRLDVYRFHRGL